MRTPACAALAFLLVHLTTGCDSAPAGKPLPNAQIAATAATGRPAEYLFCHWNVENLFDDQNDGRTGPGDKEYDAWFAEHPEMLSLKLSKMTDALLKMNNGKGPDILAIVEVESIRAAELLQKALNARLPDRSLHYQHVLMKEVGGGRHISPAILTRLPVIKDRTRTLDRNHRILVAHIKVNEHELVVIASHWTSRLQESGKMGRATYADKIYGACNAIARSNPAADFVVSGDFNDDPDDDAVANRLHASGDLQAVRTGESLHLFNLCAGKEAATQGTHYYKQWHIFDQMVVSPGMLDDKGWSCDPQSFHVVNELHRTRDKQKRPWRFGGPNEKGERGYSDHFPVTMRLRAAN